MIRKVFVVAALLGAILGLPAGAIAQDGATAVSIQDDVFSPRMAQTSAGNQVIWSNDGAEDHTVTADDGSFDTGGLGSGETFGFTFSTPGQYAYYCAIHGGPGGVGMSGVIVVN